MHIANSNVIGIGETKKQKRNAILCDLDFKSVLLRLRMCNVRQERKKKEKKLQQLKSQTERAAKSF